MNFSLTHREHAAFHLMSEGKAVAAFKYNRSSGSIRIDGTQKRLFFISQEGFLQNKIRLKTEYGVEIGESTFIRSQHKGTLTISDNKFHYRTDGGGLYLSDRKKQILAAISFDGAHNVDGHELSAIVFSIAWLLNETAAHKALTPYAS